MPDSALGKAGVVCKLVGVWKPGRLLREGRVEVRLCCLNMGNGARAVPLCILIVKLSASSQLCKASGEETRIKTRSSTLLECTEKRVLGEDALVESISIDSIESLMDSTLDVVDPEAKDEDSVVRKLPFEDEILLCNLREPEENFIQDLLRLEGRLLSSTLDDSDRSVLVIARGTVEPVDAKEAMNRRGSDSAVSRKAASFESLFKLMDDLGRKRREVREGSERLVLSRS